MAIFMPFMARIMPADPRAEYYMEYMICEFDISAEELSALVADVGPPIKAAKTTDSL